MYRIAVVIVIGLGVLGIGDVEGAIIEFHSDDVIREGDDYLNASVYGTAMVDMEGGRVDILVANDSSTVNVHDGWIFDLYAGDSSTVNLFGGVIDHYIQAGGSSTVYIHGYGFEVTLRGVKGYWLDGTEFDLWLRRTGLPDPHYVLVPEPGTLTLLSLGGLLFVRRKQVPRCQ